MNSKLCVHEIVSTTGNTTKVHGRVYDGSVKTGQQFKSIDGVIQARVISIETHRVPIDELREGWTGTFNFAMEVGELPSDTETILEGLDD